MKKLKLHPIYKLNESVFNKNMSMSFLGLNQTDPYIAREQFDISFEKEIEYIDSFTHNTFLGYAVVA